MVRANLIPSLPVKPIGPTRISLFFTAKFWTGGRCCYETEWITGGILEIRLHSLNLSRRADVKCSYNNLLFFFFNPFAVNAWRTDETEILKRLNVVTKATRCIFIACHNLRILHQTHQTNVFDTKEEHYGIPDYWLSNVIFRKKAFTSLWSDLHNEPSSDPSHPWNSAFALWN